LDFRSGRAESVRLQTRAMPDGTKNFSCGVPVWATLIALEREGEAVCGVISAPALGHRW
jgi:Inositol monophosphatase family